MSGYLGVCVCVYLGVYECLSGYVNVSDGNVYLGVRKYVSGMSECYLALCVYPRCVSVYLGLCIWVCMSAYLAGGECVPGYVCVSGCVCIWDV